MPSRCELVVTPAVSPRGTAIIRIKGEIDGSAKGPLPLAYNEAVADFDPVTVMLDFSAVDYINSTGIAVIVGILAQARAEHRAVSAAGLSEHYKHIFTITRLVDFIELVDAAPTNTTV
jgi:anti-sigma B factor antagonist